MIAALLRLLRRQKIRAHIRAEQEEFLREHPELRIQPGTTDRTERDR